MLGTYSFDGNYLQDGEEGLVRGDLEILADGTVQGHLCDQDSPSSHRRVKGIITTNQNKRTLDILCLVTHPDYLNIRYELTENTSGRYQGIWTPVAKKIVDKVLSGPHQGSFGVDYYRVQMAELIPHEDDVGGPVELSFTQTN